MNYRFDSIVNKQEANALKEMIFKRAKERAQTMNENVQADVMDMARDSFVDNNNPFAKMISQETSVIETTEANHNVNNAQQAETDNSVGTAANIGFAPKEVKVKQNKILNEQLVMAEIHNNMAEAREALTNKKSFMGALSFLNAQAAISLARTRADKFEIIA